MNLSVRVFHELMKKRGNFTGRDFDVVVHGDLKWKQFAKFISWRGKSVHDVGCHIALIPIRAKNKGASFVMGYDRRKDIVDFNNEIVTRLLPVDKGHLKTIFVQEDLADSKEVQTDIRLCLGVINKFPAGVFERMVEKLCIGCKETLVLETCFDYGENQDLNVKVNPPGALWHWFTRVSRPYLRKLLADNGFHTVHEIPSVVYHHHQRETWIAERNK